MSDSGEFKHESVQDRESIVKYLDALSAGFAEGRLSFTLEDKEFVFEPEGLLDFEIKTRRKGDASRISIRISWKHNQAEPNNNASFTINPVNHED